MLGCGTRALGVRHVVGGRWERLRLGRFWGLAPYYRVWLWWFCICRVSLVVYEWMGQVPQNLPYIYKEYSSTLFVLCKETRNLAFLLNIFLKKACVIFKNVLPLHPLSGTKLPVSVMKEFIERFT